MKIKRHYKLKITEDTNEYVTTKEIIQKGIPKIYLTNVINKFYLKNK